MVSLAAFFEYVFLGIGRRRRVDRGAKEEREKTSQKFPRFQQENTRQMASLDTSKAFYKVIIIGDSGVVCSL